MRNRALLIVVVACASFAACAKMEIIPRTKSDPPPGASTRTCDATTPCRVVVTLVDCNTFTFDPEVLKIGGAHEPRVIQMKIDTPQWVFASDDAVMIQDDSAHEFDRPMPNGAVVTINFKNSFSKPHGYPYRVKVVKPSAGTTCTSPDPWFVN